MDPSSPPLTSEMSGDVAYNSSDPHKSVKRAKCNVPGCGKVFNRKEHLTRHLKSHDPHLQYECRECGRRYARSDVFKRHVRNHSQGSSSKRILAVCTSCQERKLKCDDNIPCQSCAHNSIVCSRTATQPEGDIISRMQIDESAGRNITRGYVKSSKTISHNMYPPSIDQDARLTWPTSIPGPWPNSANVSDGLVSPVPQSGAMEDEIQRLRCPGDTQISEEASIKKATRRPLLVAASISEPRVESLTNSPCPNLNQTDETDRSSVLHLSTSKIFSQDRRIEELQIYLESKSFAFGRLVKIYFEEIHPLWPILHAPTFVAENTSKILLGSMLMLASWLKGEADHLNLQALVFDALCERLPYFHASSNDMVPVSMLQTLQALLLCTVYAISSQNLAGMKARVLYLNSILICSCRQIGIFEGSDVHERLGDNPFAQWLAQEELHRLAFAALRADAYLSLLFDCPPSIRYQEITIPLPKSARLWNAITDAERRSLHWDKPAGREKTLFTSFMREAVDITPADRAQKYFNEADYHLGLCALQSGTWDAAREGHLCAADDLISDSVSREAIHIWRAQLTRWRAGMENRCQLRQRYFSASPSDADVTFPPLNLMVWHLASLTIHAPLKLLQGLGCCYKCRRSGPEVASRAKTRTAAWLQSKCARVAVWDAAQICRVFGREAADPSRSRLLLNPLTMPAMLKSAVAVCTYAYHTRACPKCTGGPPIDVVDLFSADDDEERLIRWKEEGSVLASWGLGGSQVCNCEVTALAAWFRLTLSRDTGAQKEFMTFLGILGRSD